MGVMVIVDMEQRNDPMQSCTSDPTFTCYTRISIASQETVSNYHGHRVTDMNV